MRKYGKWALTLGLLAAMPGLTFAAGEAQGPRSAGEAAAASPNQAKANEIAKALKAAGVKGKGIELEYQNGVVVISGQVNDAAMRTAAERTINRVPGVTSVSNQLSVAKSTAAIATRSTEMPGGVVEAGEAPWAGAVRELDEELGTARPVGRLLVVDHVLAHDGRPDGMVFVFDGGVLDEADVAAFVFRDGEILSAGLYTLEQARGLGKPMLAERLTAALAAVREGSVVLCQDGLRIS